jgi:hypothetical protein
MARPELPASAAEPGRGGWGPATDVTAAIEAAALRLVEHGRRTGVQPCT